jgi:SHAQKYF class myb-like DNA-binding protein
MSTLLSHTVKIGIAKIRVRDLLNDTPTNEAYDIVQHPVNFPQLAITTPVTTSNFTISVTSTTQKKQNAWEMVHANFFVPGRLPGSDDRKPRKGWTKNEHVRFLLGVKMHGRGNWKLISKLLNGKSPKQVQSHAQKYFLRQEKVNKNKRSIHDFNDADLDELLRDEHYLESLKQKESDLYQLIQQYEAGFPNMQQVITQEVTTPDNMDDTTKDSDDY